MRGQLSLFPPEYIRDMDCTKDTPLMYGHPDTSIYGTRKRIRPRVAGRTDTDHMKKIYLEELLPLEEYDLIVVLFSGGKDSMACYYKLLELGVPKEKIELWHHDIDGGHPSRRMDWRCTQNYVRAFAEAEGVPLRLSWRVNGFFGELYRIGASEPVEWMEPDSGEIMQCRPSTNYLKCLEIKERATAEMEEELKQLGYRMKFPAKTGDLSRRWCSAYLKIMVADSVMSNLDALGELEELGGKCGKFPAKGSIGGGRWCSAQLKREVADSVIRNINQLEEVGGKRHKFPAKGGTHQGRWCSGNLKAAVQDSVTANLEKTRSDKKILIVSGERRGESAGRAKYNEMEIHRTNAEKKAREMRYKKPIVKDLNLDSIKQYLWEIQEECDDARWCYDDEDTLIDALDGDEEEAYEFRMMFSDLSAECDRMQDDLNNWSYIDKLEELFDLFFVAVGAGNDFGGLLGYDTYEQDYFGIDTYISSEWVEKESRKKIERMTKKDIMDTARLSFRIYQSYVALRYRHDCLKASLDILREKNAGYLQMIKQFEELYEKVDKETNGFKYNWKDSVKELDRVLNAMPQEVWLW